MVQIRKVETADSKTIAEFAELHVKAFPDFFLTQLGRPFLKALYRGYVEDPKSGVLVAEEDGKLLGIVLYSMDYPGFFKKLIRHHLLRFAFCSFLAFIRHPSFAGRLLGAFKKGDSVVKTEKYVEFASLCVDPEAGRRGIGTQLVTALKAQVDFSEYAYINLETDADNNESVNRFHQKNGFKLARTYTTAEGRRMNEYRYAPEEKA